MYIHLLDFQTHIKFLCFFLCLSVVQISSSTVCIYLINSQLQKRTMEAKKKEDPNEEQAKNHHTFDVCSTHIIYAP